jgi:hypothetical protein
MAHGRIYTVVTGAVSVSAAQDLFEITPADDKPVELVGLTIDQTGVADIGDAAEEFIRWTVYRGFTSSGSGGSAPTPRPIKRAHAAAGFTAEVNNTTVATTGTSVILHEGAFNVRGPYIFWWPDGCEPDASQGDTTILVRIPAPADAITLSATLYVRELG